MDEVVNNCKFPANLRNQFAYVVALRKFNGWITCNTYWSIKYLLRNLHSMLRANAELSKCCGCGTKDLINFHFLYVLHIVNKCTHLFLWSPTYTFSSHNWIYKRVELILQFSNIYLVTACILPDITQYKICNRSKGTQVKYFLTRWVIHCNKNIFHTAYLQLYVHSLFVTNFEVAVVFCVAVTPIILQRPSFTYFFAH